jgi:hypothetical protein
MLHEERRMPSKIIAAAPDHSLRPLTQVLVGALEVAMEEIFLLRGSETGPWMDALEELMLSRARDLEVSGVDANAVQVAESAIRATVRAFKDRDAR